VNSETKLSRKGFISQGGESDDFDLPIAPPTPPLRTAGAPVISADTGDTSSESVTTTRVSTQSNPLFSTPVESTEESDAPPDVPILNTPNQTPSKAITVVLACVILLLLVIMGIQSNQEPYHDPTVAASQADKERKLVASREEARTYQNELEQMTRKIKDLEEQLETSQTESKNKLAGLLRENGILTEKGSELNVEIVKLKNQLQTALSRATAQPLQKSPEPARESNANAVDQRDYPRYIVTGLRPGDYLQVRSGPGSNYDSISYLLNGNEISVIGAAVMNDTDEWRPCHVTVNRPNPAAGSTQTLTLKGWVNSYFIVRSVISGVRSTP